MALDGVGDCHGICLQVLRGDPAQSALGADGRTLSVRITAGRKSWAKMAKRYSTMLFRLSLTFLLVLELFILLLRHSCMVNSGLRLLYIYDT